MTGRLRKWSMGCLAALLPALALAGEPAMKTRTASAEFDRLFALAQRELEQDKVEAITDWSFNDQEPFPCACFETGEKWHYVWTRDLSYAADLALARLEPERTKTSLRFKLGRMRARGIPGIEPGSWMVAQDTGSGGSWPISTDRVVWFLAARHLVKDDPAFRSQVRDVLANTLKADDTYAFDASMGLYRGETSFLDWREQNYPSWTAKDTTWIGESFALSTNVLHYEALRLAAALQDSPAMRGAMSQKADALRDAIDRHFWNEARGMYRSYIGPAWAPVPVESYDLLGTSLVILSGIAPQDRARRALANYPVAELGSPVIWPQQPDTPIYHNRAMWPFVSEYALRAARATKNAERIAFEMRSLMRGAAKAGSNMENYELTTQAVHFEDGKLSGPVVNSPRQLWSVAAYLDMVLRGVFGVEDDGTIAPMLPAEMVSELFGDGDSIVLQLRDRRVVLRKPRTQVATGLLVSGAQRTRGKESVVELVPMATDPQPLKRNGAVFAPKTPEVRQSSDGSFHGAALVREPNQRLYMDGKPTAATWEATDLAGLPVDGVARCYNVTNLADGMESLPSRTTCLGAKWTVPWSAHATWTPPAKGRYRVFVRYRNANGPVNTGVTAAVQRVELTCPESARIQQGVIVMPHNEAETDSTSWTFDAPSRDCKLAWFRGTNMSDLDHFAHYTGGKGGASGPLNQADIRALTIVPLP